MEMAESGIDLTTIWDKYQLGELEAGIHNLFPTMEFSMEAILGKVLKGDILGCLSDLITSVIQNLSAELSGMKNLVVYLLILGIVSALLSHLIEVFDNHQVADISFYFMYLLLITILMKSFHWVAGIAYEAVENIVTFMKLFIPTYLISMSAASGIASAYAYYQLIIFLLFGVENVLLAFILPMIYGYVMLALLNGIWVEERLTLLIEFMGKGIRLCLKGAIGLITGISLFQSMITPVIDSARTAALQKTISMIPGIGNVTDGVIEVVMCTAVLIKNSIGVVCLLLLCLLCLVPMIKIFVVAGLLKFSAALLGIVCNRRITGCTNKVGEGSMLLFQTVGTAMVLFGIMIAVAAYTINPR